MPAANGVTITLNKMIDWKSLIEKNRKLFIGILILIVLLFLLIIFSFISRLRDQQTTDQTTQPAAQTAQETVSIYSTTPNDKEVNVPLDTNITITFNEAVSLKDFSFKHSSDLKLNASQLTTNSLLLKNQSSFKPNQKYEFKIIINNQGFVFEGTEQKTYSFSFTAGKDKLGEAIRKSIK